MYFLKMTPPVVQVTTENDAVQREMAGSAGGQFAERRRCRGKGISAGQNDDL
jgi:hypothetical protein